MVTIHPEASLWILVKCSLEAQIEEVHWGEVPLAEGALYHQ